MLPTEAFRVKDQVSFLDVRKPYEFEAGHVEGATHITLQELPERFPELDPNVPVVVTCQIGQRSELAVRFLREHGFESHNLEGGLERWVAEGLPLVATAGTPGTVVDGWAETLTW